MKLRARISPMHGALCIALLLPAGSSAGQIDRIRVTHAIVIAHRDASIPFSYLDANQQPIGYTMDLCAKLVTALERELKIPTIKVRYLPVTSAKRINAIADGSAAMLRDSFKYPSDKVADFSE